MLRVLIADDERLVREMLKSIIHWGDCFVCCGEAADGVDAFDMALSLRPDIIITDVRMPGLDGLSVVSRLSNLLPQTAIIVVSGFDEFSYVKKALDLGAIAYALKPVKQEEINSALKRAAEKVQAYQITQSAMESLPAAAEKFLRIRPIGDLSFPSQLQEDLVFALYSSNLSELNIIIKKMGKYFADNAVTATSMKRVMMIIIADILRIANNKSVEHDVLNQCIELGRQIDRASTWQQLEPPFIHFCNAISSELSKQNSSSMDKILEYLHNNFNDPLSLSRIAAAHNMSQSNFSLTFKRHVGVTFSDYVLRLRMEKAKELLRQNKYKIHMVAQMVGYEDFGYFGKLFKRYTGMQPSAYQSSNEAGKTDEETV